MNDIQFAKEQLNKFVGEFEPVLKEYFKQEYNLVQTTFNEDCINTLSFYEDVVKRGGKRLRGSFVYFVYKMFGGENIRSALELGIVIELIHAYLLVIDDFNDRSATRRGGPTVHEMAKDYFDKNNLKYDDKNHFGYSVAVLSGLMGNHMAMELISDLKATDETKLRLYLNLNEKITITAYGQLTDFFNETRITVDENDVLNMLKWKTGVYTYENPIHMGAILAGQSNDVLKKLSEYAIPAGIAFQIQDDILGVFGDPEITGKSSKSDIEEGKITLLINYALRNSTEMQKKELLSILGKNNITNEEHSNVKEILTDTGSLDFSVKKAIEFTAQAKESLEKNKENSWDSNSVRYLHGIADYMIARSK